jgi:DNA invertase Pin-like site-specific DNA recombinase
MTDPRRRLSAVPDVPRFAIAVRVSRVMGRSGERFLSPEIQISGSRTAVERIGGVIDVAVGDQGVFYDLDVSGAVNPDDRPGLGAALDLVRAGRLEGVVVFDLSRFSRDTAGGLRALEEIAAAGGQVLSASETIDLQTPAGVFSTTVQLAANRLRRDEASKAWKATHARRFEMGLPHGKLPYGYVNAQGGAVPDPVTGPALTLAFMQYATGSVSQKALAEHLGALRGRSMRQGVISQLLRNRFYLGELELHGQTRQGRHTPLVDEVTFAAVQRRLSFERADGPHWRVPGSPLIGLVFCAVCGGPLYRLGDGARGGRPRPSRMVCSGLLARTCPGVGTPRVDETEDAVKALALDEAAQLQDQSPAHIVRSSRAARSAAELKRLRAEQTALLNQIGRLGVSLARDVMTEAGYREAVKQIQEELATVDRQVLELEVAEVSVTRPLEELASAADRIVQLWDVMTPLEQRAMLMVFLPAVRIRRAGYRGEPMAARLLTESDEGVWS